MMYGIVVVDVCIILGTVLLIWLFNQHKKKDHFTSASNKFPPTPHIGPDGKTVVWNMDTGVATPVFTLVLKGPVSEYFKSNPPANASDGIVNAVLTKSDMTILYIDAKAPDSVITPTVSLIQGIPLYKCEMVSMTNNPPTSGALLLLTSHCGSISHTASTLSTTRTSTSNTCAPLVTKARPVVKHSPPVSLTSAMKPNISWRPPPIEPSFQLPSFTVRSTR